MVEMEMELESVRVERLRMQQLGEDWIRAIQEEHLDRLAQFCSPAVTSILLTPNHLDTLHTSGDLVAKYHDWFDDYSNFRLEASRVALVGERLGVFYRLRLQNQGDWYTIEQQAYLNLKDGRVEKLRLLCSGFQPVGSDDMLDITDTPEPAEQDPGRDELLEFHSEAAEAGGTCALLTPAIKSKLRGMQTGQVLEVRVDDPTARDDIEAWSRLSGNRLLKMVADGNRELRFFVEKK